MPGPDLPARRVALVCLTPRPDAQELGSLRLPSFGIRRIQAALLSDPDLADAQVALIDRREDDVAGYVEEILAFAPDLVGFSVYVWSAPTLIAVARGLRARRPALAIVFGGPSARSAFFDLDPYRPAHAYLDALCEGDGEEIIRDIAKLPAFFRAAWESVRGLTLPTEAGWVRTPPRPQIAALDRIASPYAHGLMPRGGVAYLETFRGCPLSCRFCEWGSKENTKAAFSADYIAAELDAFRRHEAPAVFLLDAGLNLNLGAFRNLRLANQRSGFLKEALFWAEIYPSIVRDEHLAFIEEIGTAYLGVGMQSMDPAVLRLHDRPSDSPRFEAAVRALARVTNIELQIIAVLPGDTPEGFRRTLDYALSLPASVRVYHCLVLPDALLTRSRPEWSIDFDPVTLTMRSCSGWSEEAVAQVRAELRGRALAAGGKAGEFWWSFPRREERPSLHRSWRQAAAR
ncbi:radical SAM protein [Methylobacterium durans]|uniref:B12-binding domain-containing radical SAM protein n=1 Tax=Methylobacterium durans TaxID=2202825 RepID=UPI002AFECC89|nr:radical SAM protein [Methylobacterium durans]MEA1834007.1 radical SAM protein [Methylobacterium durans]